MRPASTCAGLTCRITPARTGADDCSFKTILRRYDLADPVLWRIAQTVDEAELDDARAIRRDPGRLSRVAGTVSARSAAVT